LIRNRRRSRRLRSYQRRLIHHVRQAATSPIAAQLRRRKGPPSDGRTPSGAEERRRMESAGRHLAALCREIVRVALRTHAQQRELEVHDKRLDLLEGAVADLSASRGPRPLEVARRPSSDAGAVASLERSFERRLQAAPGHDAPE